ncbi:enoyl-CoA hydratase/isomerase family protein [Nakamurella leprariae]|uniref:Enoyl-CoA hydratase/isomerase family protein n=1 Tax=Nakamurella leprariae TaxID=2803911 RepID=A0A939C397_9ACTN|nr:enoyl-CoA hydratase/isomerase family protein [Nakamurella leprariae]MBM9468882.1 enoyl-CoA hydratase/isomerase family protein [Nakamurella leprariae]
MDLFRTELRDDGVFVAAYENPPMNYFTGQATAELGELVARWRYPDVRAVVITGAPEGQYITHFSVEEVLERAADLDHLRAHHPERFANRNALLQAITYLDKPVVAAITGDAGGAGLELSLNCDIRIMQRGDFRVGFPEAALGILTGTGSQLLTKIIGHGRALDFLLRSRYVSPEGALELGIVNELADDAKARGIEVASGLARQSPAALAAAKRSVVRGGNLPIAEGLRIEAEEWLKAGLQPQAIELMQSYVNTPYDQRRAWVEEHGVWPEPGMATGS